MFGLLIVCYLFLGGAGAGAFAISAAADLFLHSRRHRDQGKLSRIEGLLGIIGPGFLLSLIALVLGTVCLLADLGRPDVAYLIFAYPSFTIISVGAYALALLMLCAGLLAANWALVLPQIPRALVTITEVIGLVLAFVVMAYTGLLLQSMEAIALWGSPFVPLLFVFSSLSTGSALLVGSAPFIDMGYSGHSLNEVLGNLARFGVIITACEVICAAALLLMAAGEGDTASSVQALLAGEHAAAFWMGFVFCGILLPLLTELLVQRRCGRRIAVGIAASVLVGGFYLRFCIVGAGIHPGIASVHAFGT